MKNVNSDRLPKGTNIVIVNDFDYTQGGASKVAIDTANMLVEHCDDVNIYFFQECIMIVLHCTKV